MGSHQGILFLTLFLLSFASRANDLPRVDTILVIAVDVSGSIDDEEYARQKNGIVSAFRDPVLHSRFSRCTDMGLAISYVEWAGEMNGSQVHHVGERWFHLKSPEDMIAFSDFLAGQERSFKGGTNIAQALTFSNNLISEAPFQSERKVISLSGDGSQSYATGGDGNGESLSLDGVRTGIDNSGVVINVIAIATPDVEGAIDVRGANANSLTDYFENYVKVGTGAFVLPVNNFVDYGDAIVEQVSRSLNNMCTS